MDPTNWPPIPADLLDHLEKLVPERSPMPGESMEELQRRGGQRDLVRVLRAVFTQQNETVLNVLSP